MVHGNDEDNNDDEKPMSMMLSMKILHLELLLKFQN